MSPANGAIKNRMMKDRVSTFAIRLDIAPSGGFRTPDCENFVTLSQGQTLLRAVTVTTGAA